MRFCGSVGLRGWAVLLAPGAGPPFRPEQKVKLDKTEAGKGGLFLRHGFWALTLELPPSSTGSLSGPPAPSVPGFPREIVECSPTWLDVQLGPRVWL